METLNQFANYWSGKFEPKVRHHLAKVYLCLAGTTSAATVGAVLHLTNILQASLLIGLISVALLLGLLFTRSHDEKNFYARLAMLLGFGFCSGQSLGPLLQLVISINPQLVISALTGTIVVFVSLTLSSLLAERGKFLFLGGILVSIVNTLLLLSILNMFMGSYYVNQAQLYVGLVIMCGFILYDTQSIVEKNRNGDTDCIKHSLDLFFDVVTLFRKLLIVLAQKEQRGKQNKEKNK